MKKCLGLGGWGLSRVLSVRAEGTFQMKSSARSSRVAVSADGRGLVSQAGAVLLWETMRVTGLGRGLVAALERWWAPRAVHDPGKIVVDLAGDAAPGSDGGLVTVDLDATIVIAHSEKEQAARPSTAIY